MSFDLVYKGDVGSAVLYRGTEENCDKVLANFNSIIKSYFGCSGYLCFPYVASDPKKLSMALVYSDPQITIAELNEDIQDALLQGVM